MNAGTLAMFSAFGVMAGTLTTIAGQGGGLVLLLACSAVVGPHEALALTAPALLLGNAHRAFLLRAEVDRAIAARVVLGVIPGGLLGGLLAGVTPAWALRVMLVLMTALAIGKAAKVLRFEVPRRTLAPAGAVIGAMTGTAGGAGVLFAPLLLSTGLTGRAYVGTVATVAVAAHASRIVGYGALGLFSRTLVGATIATTLAIFVGNAVGDRLRGAWGDRSTTWFEYGTLLVCVALSLAGLA